MTQRLLRMVDGFQHRRGLSDGSVLQDRDEELALFQDMRTRENNDSLNPSTDEIDESLSIRLRRLLDTSTQTRKNDYNWLLTPPGTPHFPPLKQDAPCVNISETGTLRSEVISVPHVSSRTTSRGNSCSPISRISASPRRSSTTSCSSGPSTYSQGRASSSQTGNLKLQPLTSSGRLATSSRRSSTPPAKSSTTALRRSSTSPRGHLSSAGRGGYSPQKNRHGCSSSPKIRPWQSGLPGFPPEQPPNLRTTLSDLSTSRSRRLCPASRHGEETGNKPRGQSVSPRISRLANSSKNYDSDRLSSYSKSSVVSSCEDEIDSISSATSVKKIAYTKNTVHHQVTRKKGSNANIEAQSTSKKQVKPSATNVSSGSGSTVRQLHLRQNSKSMFRPLMSSAPVASFYTYKRSNFLHQGSSINTSVTTSSNASSEQGARVAPYTEAGDHNIADVSDESRECLTSLCPKEIFAFDKQEMKVEDAERHCVDSSIMSQEQRDCLEMEQISYVQDLHSNSYVYSSGKPDTGNLGKPLLDGNESVKRIPSVTGSHGYDCYQDGDMGHAQKYEHGYQIDEHREVCLYFKKDVIYSNSEYLGRSIVDMQEDNSSNFMSIKNVSDDISENLQASLLRNFEIAKMRKHDLESRKYVIMHEATKNQVKETDCHTMCFQDQFSAGQMTGSNNMNFMSKFKKVEEITHCEGRGNVQHQTKGVDFSSQHMPDKDAWEHNVEHSPECVTSGELPSKVKTPKESVLQVEAISSINSWRDCFHLRSCGNDLMKSAVYSTCNSVPGPGSIEQTGTTDLCQTDGRKIDLENITSNSSINVLTGLSILSADGEKSTYQTPVCSEKVPIDYFQNILEMPSTVETNALDHTASKIPPDNLVNSAGISSIYTVSDLNSPPAGAQSQTHQAPIHNDNASGNPCTNYYLDVPEMTNTVKTKTLRHTEAASKGLTGELADIASISSIDMLSGLNIPTAKVQNNAHQTPGHSENVGEKALNDYSPDVFEITKTVKTNTLVHSAAASKGVSIPTAKLQSNAHQTSGHSENASENTYIDYCPDVFEITRIVKTKTLEQSVAASRGLPESIQGGDLLSLPEEGSVCVTKEVILPMPERNLVAEVDAKINKDVEVETSNQKENMLCNDALSPEKQDHRYACTDSFKQSEKFGTAYIKIRSNAVREANKLAAGSPEQEMKSTSDDDLQTDMTNCSIQAFPDSIVLNDNAIAHERKLVGLHEIQINIQHEAVASTKDLTILQTDKEPFASVASQRYNHNQNDDAESKRPSYYDSPGHAHYFQDNSGVDTDAATASLSRSLALAEATDTVLLCSTIVHNLIDKAANIGMEKENVIAVGNPSTSVTLVAMPAEVQRNLSVGAAAPHTSFKPKRTKPRQAIAAHRVQSNKFDNNIRDGERVLQVVVIPQRDAIAHEKKRKWKCCCTIM